MNHTDEERAAALEQLTQELAGLIDTQAEQAPVATTHRTARQALTQKATRAGRRTILCSNTTTQTSTDEHQHH